MPPRFLPVLALFALASSTCQRPPRPAAPAPTAARVPAARVFRAEGPADLVRGPNAAGRPGDFVLENQHVRAVIDQVRGGGGFALSGGQLIDLTLRDGGLDEIGQLFNYLGQFPRQLRYTSLRTEVRPDGSAAVIVHGDDPRTPGLEGQTEYVLGADDRALTLSTTLTHRGDAPTEVGLGDAIQWAGAEHWAPGRGFALRGETEQPFLAGVGAHSAYAIAAERPLFGPNGGNWSNPMQARTTLAPGASVSYTRRLGVARAGDVAGALAATGMITYPQSMRVHVTDRTGAPLPGARVLLRNAADRTPAMMGASDAHGDAVIPAPAGSYLLEVSGPGLAPDDATAQALAIAVELPSGQTVTRTATLQPGGTLVLRVLERGAQGESEPVPARVLVYGVDGTADPMLGAVGRGEGARNSVLVSHRAPTELPLPPGRYRVLATRGPARTLAEQTVEIARDARTEVTLTVQRAVDTRGYLCGDFHTHQAPSLDSPVSMRDRVHAAAAEGLDVIASTDHNVATDLTPAVQSEGLERFLLALGGDEVSTDVALAPSGHWNLFPLVVHHDAPRGGAPDLFELDPAALVRRVREIAPDAVVQLNHPRSGVLTGAFDIVGFDRGTGRATRGALDPTFDALEVWNGRYQPQAEGVLLDWLSLLRNGARITATANSDSHAIVVTEVGWPRTCFRMPADEVASVTPADVVRSLREGRDVILTDGPFVRVESTDGQSALGRTLPPERDGKVTLRVRIESPRWSAADTLEIVHSDGRFEPVTVRWQQEAERVLGAVTVRVPASEGFVLFRARGREPVPVLLDDPPLYPMAITNPVYFAPTRAGARSTPRR